jgi:hypothetical protein
MRALPGNYRHVLFIALWFASDWPSPQPRKGSRGPGAHIAAGSMTLPNVVLRDGGLAAAVLGDEGKAVGLASGGFAVHAAQVARHRA